MADRPADCRNWPPSCRPSARRADTPTAPTAATACRAGLPIYRRDRLPRRSADLPPGRPEPPPKGIYRARYSSLIAYAYMPPIVPQMQRFAQKMPLNFVQKNFPTSPLKGDWGTKTALLTAQKSAAIMQGKRTATATAAQRTADHGDQKGEVNMTTPNTGELLVQQAQEAERLRLLILADECKTIEEFREKLRERLNK